MVAAGTQRGVAAMSGQAAEQGAAAEEEAAAAVVEELARLAKSVPALRRRSLASKTAC